MFRSAAFLGVMFSSTIAWSAQVGVESSMWMYSPSTYNFNFQIKNTSVSAKITNMQITAQGGSWLDIFNFGNSNGSGSSTGMTVSPNLGGDGGATSVSVTISFTNGLAVNALKYSYVNDIDGPALTGLYAVVNFNDGQQLTGNFSYDSGTQTWSFNKTSAVANCSFNGQTVNHGSSVTAYLASTVPFGSSCTSQSRTCNNGTLSGSYAYSSCSVQPPANCTFNGQTVNHGASVTAYQASTVPYGSSCASESRNCSNGALSGTYGYASCVVDPPPSGGNVAVYSTFEVVDVYNTFHFSIQNTSSASGVTITGAQVSVLGGGVFDYFYPSGIMTVSPDLGGNNDGNNSPTVTLGFTGGLPANQLVSSQWNDHDGSAITGFNITVNFSNGQNITGTYTLGGGLWSFSGSQPATGGSGPTINVSAISVSPGGSVTVSISGASGDTSDDWVGIYLQSETNNHNYLGYQYMNGQSSDTLVFAMPSNPGVYVFRLLPDNDYTHVATSPAVTVTSGGGGPGEDEPPVGTPYYVKVTGNDNNSGLSDAQAFRTLGRALAAAGAGDDIYLRAGDNFDIDSTYAIGASKSGWAGNPFVIGAYHMSGSTVVHALATGNDYPVIDANKSYPYVDFNVQDHYGHTDAILWVSGAAYVTIKNVKVLDSQGVGIRADGGSNLVIDHVYIEHAGGTPIFVSDMNNVDILNSKVVYGMENWILHRSSLNYWGGGIVGHRSNNVNIRRNLASKVAGEALTVYWGTTNFNITDNIVHAAYSVGIYVNSSYNGEIARNLILGTPDPDYHRWGNSAGPGLCQGNEAYQYQGYGGSLPLTEFTRNNRWHGNLVAGTATGFCHWDEEIGTTSTNIQVVNNTFVDNLEGLNGSGSMSGSAFANNIILSLSGGTVDTNAQFSGLSFYSNYFRQGSPPSWLQGAGDIYGGVLNLSKMSGWRNTPNYTDATWSSFAVQAGSSVLNAGTSNGSILNPVTDHNGDNHRSPIDMGGLRFGSQFSGQGSGAVP